MIDSLLNLIGYKMVRLKGNKLVRKSHRLCWISMPLHRDIQSMF